MTLSNVGKMGAAAVTVIGLPPSIYFAHEYSTSLYEVEKEVIEKNVKFDVVIDSAKKNVITIKNSTTIEGDSEKLGEGHSWVCTITTVDTIANPTFAARLEKNLPTTKNSSVEESKKRENKELLVKACSKNRIESPSNISVKANIFAKEVRGYGIEDLLFEDKKLNVLVEKNS